MTSFLLFLKEGGSSRFLCPLRRCLVCLSGDCTALGCAWAVGCVSLRNDEKERKERRREEKRTGGSS